MTEETAAPGLGPEAPDRGRGVDPPDDARPEPRARIDLVDAISKATRADYLCIGGILAGVVVGLASYPLSAFLLAHVAVHLVATASLSALLTAGSGVFYGTQHLWLVLPLAVIGLTKFDAFYFWAGRRYGDYVAQFLEEQGSIRPRTVARAERWVARFGPPLLTASYFLPVPTTLVMVLLGASGVSWFAFWIADLAGTLIWIGVFLAVGHHFHTEVHHIAKVVNHYSLLVGLGLLVVVIVVGYFRTRRQLATQA